MRAGEVEPATPALLNSNVTGPSLSLDVVGQRGVGVAVAHVEDGGHDVGDARRARCSAAARASTLTSTMAIFAPSLGERPSDAEPDALGAAGHERDAARRSWSMLHYGLLLRSS